MKSIQFFDDHITSSASELIDEKGQPQELTKFQVNAIKARIEFFKTCRNYILSNPSEEFIKSEIARLEAFINAKLVEFSDGVDTSRMNVKAASDLRKKHEDKYEIPHKRKQLKALRFLLD